MLQLGNRGGDASTSGRTSPHQLLCIRPRNVLSPTLKPQLHRRSIRRLLDSTAEPRIRVHTWASDSTGSEGIPGGIPGKSQSTERSNESDPELSTTASTDAVSQQPASSSNGSESPQATTGNHVAESKSHPPFPAIPWGWGKVVQVMVLWLLAYIIIGQVAVPILLSLLGLDRDELSARGHALLHLGLDLSQLAVTLGILWGCLKKYKPRQRGLFPVKLGGRWILAVLLAACTFPAVNWLAEQSMNWFPIDGEYWAGTMEASLSGGDWVTNAAYFSVVSICAPVWEEAIFRGFLLTSLTRYMPPPAAVALSSLLFAMCHFKMQTFLPLLVLGVLFSSVFLGTRNLLPPVVAHSLWNIYVLATIMWRPA